MVRYFIENRNVRMCRPGNRTHPADRWALTSASPLGIQPPLVIRAAPVVVVVVRREQDVEDGAARASNERVTVILAGVQAHHIRRGYDERQASPPRPPTSVVPMGF